MSPLIWSDENTGASARAHNGMPRRVVGAAIRPSRHQQNGEIAYVEIMAMVPQAHASLPKLIERSEKSIRI
jgi:hypothetical protein